MRAEHGYAAHDHSIRDVDDDRWAKEEKWAIEDALTYARLEQRPGLPTLAPGPDFMEFFERMLDANLHRPLDLCVDADSQGDADSEQQTLAGWSD